MVINLQWFYDLSFLPINKQMLSFDRVYGLKMNLDLRDRGQ